MLVCLPRSGCTLGSCLKRSPSEGSWTSCDAVACFTLGYAPEQGTLDMPSCLQPL